MPSSSEEDEIFVQAVVQGAIYYNQQVERPIARRRAPLNRDRSGAHDRLIADYFAPNPTYGEDLFKRRFRMSQNLFTRIAVDLEQKYEFFQQRYDGRGKLGFSCFQKCTAALRQLAYGTCSDAWDEYLQMSERTARESLYEFSIGVIETYADRYLRKPNWFDIQLLQTHHDEYHGFPGMLGSIDCMHWEWENCPVAWQGQFHRGDHPNPSIILEAVASQDLWIWHAFFGVAGSNNDINVIDQSPVFNDLIEGVAPGQQFICNDNTYKYGYYLADGIYPTFSTLVKSFTTEQTDEKCIYFKARQESARKDIERAFGVLRKKWHMIKNPARAWKPKRIRAAMYACIILHNMIIEDTGRNICQYVEDEDPDHVENVEITNEQRLQNRQIVRSEDIHLNLKMDLIQHMWKYRRVVPAPAVP